MLFRDPVEVVRCYDPTEVPAALARLDRALSDSLYVAGYIHYDALPHHGAVPAGRQSIPLVHCLVCDRPEPVDVAAFLREQTNFEYREDGVPVPRQRPAEYSLTDAADRLPGREEQQRFMRSVERIREDIAAGRVYQVNYTRRNRFDFSGDALALYQELRRHQPTPYSAYIEHRDGAVLSFSPELFFALHESEESLSASELRLETRPMKGTAPRHPDPGIDAEIRDGLAADPKNRAELAMIVDLLRNDLGRHAKFGGVEVPPDLLFRCETHPTLHQMTATIRARFDVRTHGERLFQKIFPAIFPCGSITGAPKLAARKIIAELEDDARGVYTGAVGYAHRSDARFNVAIRTLEIRGERASYGSGCGIVWDSVPEDEYREYLLKQSFLRPAVDGFALIETMFVREQGAAAPEDRVLFLEEHLQRLAGSAGRFGFPAERRASVAAILAELALYPDRRRLRLRVDRRGHVRVDSSAWERDFVPLEEHFRAPEVRLTTASEPVWADNIFRRHKTTERGIYNRGLAEAQAAGFDDAVYVNEAGEVVETSIANLLILTPEGRWLTPHEDCGALRGVYLEVLSRSLTIEQVKLNLADALAAGRWFVVNSLRGVSKVSEVRRGAELKSQGN